MYAPRRQARRRAASAQSLGIERGRRSSTTATQRGAIDERPDEGLERGRDHWPGQAHHRKPAGAMTLVARVTFVVLVGATFAAFFVAQRLKSAPPVINVRQITAVLLAQRRRQARRQPTSRSSLKVRRRGDRRRRQPRRRPRPAAGEHGADAAEPSAADELGRQGRRRRPSCPTANTGCASRCATRGARRSCRRRCAWTRKAPHAAGVHRVPVLERETAGRTSSPRATARCDSTSSGVSALRDAASASCAPTRASRARSPRFQLQRPAHRCVWDGARRRQAAGPRRLHRPGAGARPGGQPRPVGRGVRGRRRWPGRPGLTVRGLTAQPPLRPVTAGGRTEFFVDARGAAYRWQRAPRRDRAGCSSAARRTTRASCSARRRAAPASTCSSCAPAAGTRPCRSSCRPTERVEVLVVVPTITWLGTDKVDDQPFDGLPNTLATGGTVRWPRMFVGRRTGCRPASRTTSRRCSCSSTAAKIRYDLTSDLDLDLTRNPRATRPRRRAARRLAALGDAHARPAACAGT